MLLNPKLLEFDKFGTSSLQVEATARFVGGALLAGTHYEWHEGRRLDLEVNKTMMNRDVPFCQF